MKFDITRYDCKSSKINKNLKFVILADFHSEKYIDEIIDIIKKENIDGILICGDFIHNNECSVVYNSLLSLRKLGKIAPVFYSFGNHEKCFHINQYFLEEENVHIVRNEFLDFNDIEIGGIDNMGNMNFLKEKSTKYKILLCHYPEFYKFIEQYADLIISGHAHGGQIRLFNQGLYAPGQGIFPKLTSGFKYNKLIISRGLANTSFIPRINNNPEIIFLKIIN